MHCDCQCFSTSTRTVSIIPRSHLCRHWYCITLDVNHITSDWTRVIRKSIPCDSYDVAHGLCTKSNRARNICRTVELRFKHDYVHVSTCSFNTYMKLTSILMEWLLTSRSRDLQWDRQTHAYMHKHTHMYCTLPEHIFL